ncbi:MAG: hypothetical protein V2I33_20610 [Kangiellaceae bacterium]|jgi:hypothetical protein|nr:hypothetical protein [Kangiellaceae bacterium]
MATLVPLRPVLANVASKQIFVELLLATLTTLEKPIAASTPEASSRFAFVDIIYDLVKT